MAFPFLLITISYPAAGFKSQTFYLSLSVFTLLNRYNNEEVILPDKEKIQL